MLLILKKTRWKKAGNAVPIDSHQKPPNNLLIRTLTIFIGTPILLGAIALGGWFHTLPVMAVGLLMWLEWTNMLYPNAPRRLMIVLGVASLCGMCCIFHYAAWELLPPFALLWVLLILMGAWLVGQARVAFVTVSLGGLVYVGLSMGFFVWIRENVPQGMWWLLAVYLSSLFGTDISAYLVGRTFGRRPFFPKISPNKTLEGAIAGFVGGALLTLPLYIWQGWLSAPYLALLVVAPFVSTAGDLFESVLKRQHQIKDSALRGFNLFPGHGGIMDRVDSLVFCVWAYWLTLVIWFPKG